MNAIKSFFVASAILLLSAACNSQQPVTEQNNQPANTAEQQQTQAPATQQPSPAPTLTQPGPMPKMTYKILDDQCIKGNDHADIALLADGNQVAVYRTKWCEVNKVIFRAGNSQAVYFSVIPSGLGGYYIYMPYFGLTKLDLENKTISEVNNKAQSIDFNSDLTKIIYVAYNESGQAKVTMQDLGTGVKEDFGMVPAGSHSQFGNIKLSPDQKKVALAVGYGPDNEYGEIYILNLTTKNYSLYKKLDSGHLQVNGWTNNNEVDWSTLK